MKRFGVLAYGVVCYLLFFATFLYLIGFVGNLLVPKSLDGEATDATLPALALNVALILIFGLQHSVMARQNFKSWVTRYIPEAAERSTFVLATCLALGLLFWQWRPLGGEVWTATNPALQGMLWAFFAFGWALVFVSTLLINHFDLFGLRQTWLYFRGREYTHLPFKTPALYQVVRHPLYVGFLFAFWATPTMTVTHLVFAVTITAYILFAIQLEERDLVRHHGTKYAQYQERVPMLVPFTKKRGDAAELAKVEA